MSITTITKTLTTDDLDALPESELVTALGDLREYAPDATATTRWIDAAGQTWDFTCHLLNVGTRAVMWSDTDEAGIDDVSVSADAYDDQDDMDKQVREYAEDIASGLGTVVGDGDTCPDCGESIEWGQIQTGQPGDANYRIGSCGCAGREWRNTERGPGNDWAVSHD